MTHPHPCPDGSSLTVTLPPGCYVQPPCLNPCAARLSTTDPCHGDPVPGPDPWGVEVQVRRDRIHLDPSETEQRWLLGLPGSGALLCVRLRHLCLSLGPQMWNKVLFVHYVQASYDSADTVIFTSCSIFVLSVFLSVCLFVYSVYVSTRLAFMILGSLQAFVPKVVSPTQHHWGRGNGQPCKSKQIINRQAKL